MIRLPGATRCTISVTITTAKITSSTSPAWSQ